MNDQGNYGAVSDGSARYPQPDTVMGPRQQLAGTAEAPSHNVARVVQIEPINHGYLVTINCQKFAVESREALLHRLGLYLNNPGQVEQDWMSGKIKW